MLARIAKAHSACHQIALAFLTRRASVFAIPKAASPAHAKENAEAGDIHLADTEIARVTPPSRGYQARHVTYVVS